jgi:hypothetical protein
MSRVMTAPGVWTDQGPSPARTYAVGFVIRQATTVGNMVPFADMRERVSDKRRMQMAEASQRRRDRKVERQRERREERRG